MMKAIDLTHTLTPHISIYPGCEKPSFSPVATWEKDGFRETFLQFTSHAGTHMDAPFHFFKNAPSLDSLSVNRFWGHAVVIDCTNIPTGNVISLSHLFPYLKEIKKVDFVLFHTGWDRFFGNDAYFHHFPVPDSDVLKQLIEMGIKGVGIDTLSIDSFETTTYPNHRILLEAGLVIVENLTGLDHIGQHCLFYALPLLFEKSDGAPVRAIAMVEDDL